MKIICMWIIQNITEDLGDVLEWFVNDNHSFSLVFISIDEEIIYPYILKKNLLKFKVTFN